MACLRAKPVVDGLEDEYEGRAVVLRADLRSETGREVAGRYGIDVVPSFVVFDASGEVVFSENGTAGVPVAEIRGALREAGA